MSIFSKTKVGILQESPFLPVSDATRRAVKETERALKTIGYNVVPFFLTNEVWDQARDYIMSMLSNGICPELFSQMED